MEYVECPAPECRQAAEVLDRWELDSTDGPIPHVRVRCLMGHQFALPTEMLARDLDRPSVSSELRRRSSITTPPSRRR